MVTVSSWTQGNQRPAQGKLSVQVCLMENSSNKNSMVHVKMEKTCKLMMFAKKNCGTVSQDSTLNEESHSKPNQGCCRLCASRTGQRSGEDRLGRDGTQCI